MDLYKLHSTPESLDFYALADSAVVELFWPKFEDNLDQLKKREGAIATDPKYSYWYARLIKERFKLGEAAIIKSPKYAGLYASDIFGKERFLEGEDAIAQDADSAFTYAMFTIKGPWAKGEPAIAKSAFYSYRYAKTLLNVKRFKAGEAALAADDSYRREWAVKYTNEILKADFYHNGKLIVAYTA